MEASWHPPMPRSRASGSRTRPDGAKQWCCRGSPLYTYVGDKKPGDIAGNNRHDIVYGDPDGKIDLSVTGGSNGPKYDEGSGFYWHTATRYNEETVAQGQRSIKAWILMLLFNSTAPTWRLYTPPY